MGERAIRVPRQERAQRTREALLEAAREELSAKGHAGATAKSIAAAAGCSVGSFYQYFGDKDAVLRELALGRFQGIAGQVVGLLSPAAVRDADDTDAEARRRFGLAIDAVIAHHRSDPGFHAVVTERRAHDAELDRVMSAGERTLIERIAELLRHWGQATDPEATAFVLFHMVEGAIHAHCLGHAHVPDGRFTAALVGSLALVARG
ncbi:MAG: hypothetical protein CMN30_11790 [Sandaracinus sp.]|nr:hypothetical protein [Sandaracinus sp.]|tara:strand:+ start:432 stop:1049 length:618 start_codon:yes stop_codon:yes gene_type:complete